MKKVFSVIIILCLAFFQVTAQDVSNSVLPDNGTDNKEVVKLSSNRADQHAMQMETDLGNAGAIQLVSIRPIPDPDSKMKSREVTAVNNDPGIVNQKTEGSSGSRAITDLTCPESSIYSQPPLGSFGISIVNGYAAYDNVLTDPGEPTISITWWMEEDYAEPALTFDITIREDDGTGKPDMVSFPKAKFTGLVVPGVNTGEIAFEHPLYVFTYYFPYEIDINAGDWIGIADFPDNGFHHFWINSGVGDGKFYLPSINGFNNRDLAFCLRGSELDLICPPGSIYSQTPNGVNGWSVGGGNFMYEKVLSNPGDLVTSISWWMSERDVEPDLSFNIEIRGNDGGAPGTLRYSYTDVDFDEVNTGETLEGDPIFLYTFELPDPVYVFNDDWIGIAVLPGWSDGADAHHFWCSSFTGDDLWRYGPSFTPYSGNDLAFCLGRYEPGLFCPDGSIYSQTPWGWPGWAGAGDVVIYDNVSGALYGNIASITWWMGESEIIPGLTFDIFIREDNAGVPGNLIASFTGLTITGTNTGKYLWTDPIISPIYSYTYNFPSPVVMGAGDWIGIRDNPTGFHHFWVTSHDGDGTGYTLSGSEYTQWDYDFSFCLSPEPIVPLSNWAIGVGIFLIIAFTVYRFRRA